MIKWQTLILKIQFALLFGIYYRQLIEREEAMMSTLHGAAFEAYCARVPRPIAPAFRVLLRQRSAFLAEIQPVLRAHRS